MTAQDIARLRELHAAATAGEWVKLASVKDISIVPHSDTTHTIALIRGVRSEHINNATYIAAAHNALPDVLTSLEQARAERDEAQESYTVAVIEIARLRSELQDTQSGLTVSQQLYAAATAERDAALAELAAVRAQLATVDDFGADCYAWGLDNKTWRPDFGEWQTWKAQEAL